MSAGADEGFEGRAASALSADTKSGSDQQDRGREDTENHFTQLLKMKHAGQKPQRS